MSTKKILLKEHNILESRFPGRKIISRETLNLAKHLRSEGIEVLIEPKGEKLEYVVKKGFQDLFQDPVRVFLVNIPVSIFLGLFTNWLSTKLNSTKKEKESCSLVIQEKKGEKTISYSQKGKVLSGDEVAKIIESLGEKQTHLQSAVDLVPPDPQKYPYPVFLEHTHKIIGWANLEKENGALMAKL